MNLSGHVYQIHIMQFSPAVNLSPNKFNARLCFKCKKAALDWMILCYCEGDCWIYFPLTDPKVKFGDRRKLLSDLKFLIWIMHTKMCVIRHQDHSYQASLFNFLVVTIFISCMAAILKNGGDFEFLIIFMYYPNGNSKELCKVHKFN